MNRAGLSGDSWIEAWQTSPEPVEQLELQMADEAAAGNGDVDAGALAPLFNGKHGPWLILCSQ